MAGYREFGRLAPGHKIQKRGCKFALPQIWGAKAPGIAGLSGLLPLPWPCLREVWYDLPRRILSLAGAKAPANWYDVAYGKRRRINAQSAILQDGGLRAAVRMGKT